MRTKKIWHYSNSHGVDWMGEYIIWRESGELGREEVGPLGREIRNLEQTPFDGQMFEINLIYIFKKYGFDWCIKLNAFNDFEGKLNFAIWAKENLQGRSSSYGTLLYFFENKQDAVFFRLAWD